MNSSTVVSSRVAFRKANVREIAALLAIAWVVPLLVHLAPWAGDRPLGAHLLPMFWAPFVAAYLYGGFVGAGVGLFAPAVNLAFAGFAGFGLIGPLAAEIVVFALLAGWAIRRAPRFLLVAPLACVLAKGVVMLASGIFGAGLAATANLLAPSLAVGLAGLVVLAALNAALVWLHPKSRAEADDAPGV
jgi:hypothetical protein